MNKHVHREVTVPGSGKLIDQVAHCAKGRTLLGLCLKS
jgi:hypothetical protein